MSDQRPDRTTASRRQQAAALGVFGVIIVVLVVLLATGVLTGSDDPDDTPVAEATSSTTSSGSSTPSDGPRDDESSGFPEGPGAGAGALRDRTRELLRRDARDTSVTGTIDIAQANIPTRSGTDGFRTSMPQVLSTQPDFVTLNEQFQRSTSLIESAVPGYGAFRVESGASDPGSSQINDNVVLWNTATWDRIDGGRIKTVENDLAYYQDNAVVWDRYVTWGTFQRKSDDAVVSVISTHQMTNPAKFPRQHGNPPLSRAEQYGRSMDLIIDLLRQLQDYGPVFMGGDMNTFASYAGDKPWSAAAKMSAQGYGWHDYNVDFLFYPQCQGVEMTDTYSGTMVSDHHWIAARFAMNGAGAGGCSG